MRNLARFVLTCVFSLLILASAAAQSVPPELYGGLKWRLIGPFRGGRAVAVSGVPGNPATCYFGAVNGGVWQTTDAGMVWKPIFDNQHIASIGAIAVAPSHPQVIYVGTGESDIRSDLSSGDGVYRSTDGGQTWTNIGLPDSRQISRIVVDPRDSSLVYVAALGHAYGPNAERGVFRSTDAGATWAKVLDLGPDIGAADLAIAAGNPGILFATMWHARRPPWSTYAPLGGPGSGLYRSRDGGQTWTHLTGAGLPAGEWNRSGVAVSPDGKRVYAVIDAKPAGLYRSDDGGDTWTQVNSDKRLTGRSWYFSNITVDPQNPDIVYIPNVALYRSEDGGKTISVVRGAPGGDDYHQIWIDPRDSSHLALATDQGTSISLNYGRTWSSWNNQPTAQLYHVITDDKFPYNVYGTQQDSGTIAVPSRTDHRQIAFGDAFTVGGSESGYIAPDPNDPNILYVASTYGGVSRFDLRTSFSQDVSPWPFPTWNTEISGRKYRAPWAPVLLFSPFDKKTLYLGTQFVMSTRDGGLHWENISPDLTGSTRGEDEKARARKPTVENAKEAGYGVVYTIAPSSIDGQLIWAGSDTGLIHLTRDGGKTWKNVTPNGLSGWSKISLIEASHFDPAIAYASFDRHRLDDQKPYLYRTRDYGESWQLIADGIEGPAFARAVREDPKEKGLLYAGTELGVYVSFDDGDHWQPLQLNLPATSVHDLVIHGDDLVIGTHGRSFWILDDITPLRQAKDLQPSTAVLYSPANAVRVDNDWYPGTPLPPEEPAGENPPDGAMLNYYLKNPASQVQLQIFDGKGSLVRSFSSDQKEPKHPALPIAERWFPKPESIEKTAGMHRVVWNLTWGSSGSDAGDGDAEGDFSPRGPRVIPGTYQVRLTVDGKSYSQTLNVSMDPRSAATLAELQHQFDLGRQIYAESIRTRQALAEVQSVQKQLSDVEQKVLQSKPELFAQVRQVSAELSGILKGGEATPNEIRGLEQANTGIAAALRVVKSSDRAVPAQAMSVFEQSDKAAKLAIDQWAKTKTGSLAQLNDQLKKEGLAPIAIAEIEQVVEYLMAR